MLAKNVEQNVLNLHYFTGNLTCVGRKPQILKSPGPDKGSESKRKLEFGGRTYGTKSVLPEVRRV